MVVSLASRLFLSLQWMEEKKGESVTRNSWHRMEFEVQDFLKERGKNGHQEE